MRYIYFDDGTRETLGSSFSLPRRTTHGVIGRNSSVPVLRHFHSVIPCERERVETPEEAGVEITEEKEPVIFTETITETDDDGNKVEREVHHEYPGVVAVERYYTPPPPDPLAEYEGELAELDTVLTELGFTEPPEDMPAAIRTMEQGRPDRKSMAEWQAFIEGSIKLLGAWAAVAPLYSEYRRRKIGGGDDVILVEDA